jgi:YidC/Oxa1 family membrane protein insertase
MTQETMGLYKRTGTNPFSSCLPILLQSPIFFGLFTVLRNLQAIAAGTKQPIGPMTAHLAGQAQSSTIFGAPLSSHFLGATDINTKIVTVVLIVLMSASQFTSQRQLMMKNMPASALDNPFAKQQKVMHLPDAVVLCVLRDQLPDRRPALLADHQRLVEGTAVLHDPPDAGPRFSRREGPRSPPDQEWQGAQEVHHSGAEPRHRARRGPGQPGYRDQAQAGQRQQPKRKNRARPSTSGDGKPGPKRQPGASPSAAGDGDS